MQLIAFKAIKDFSIHDQMRASVQMDAFIATIKCEHAITISNRMFLKIRP